jgi:excisionase family DNA binding protein
MCGRKSLHTTIYPQGGKNMTQFMTIKEVGEYLRLSAQSVKRMIEDGRLVAHKIGRCSYRIPEDAVKALLTTTLTTLTPDTTRYDHRAKAHCSNKEARL